MAAGDAPAARWEHLEHDADLIVAGHGGTLAEAFEQAALGLTAIVTDAEVRPETRVEVALSRADPEILFVDWLDAVIFEMSVRRMLFGRFSVEISGDELRGAMWGEPVDVERHRPACEPKGATLTALAVARDDKGWWSARCVVDV